MQDPLATGVVWVKPAAERNKQRDRLEYSTEIYRSEYRDLVESRVWGHRSIMHGPPPRGLVVDTNVVDTNPQGGIRAVPAHRSLSPCGVVSVATLDSISNRGKSTT